MDNDDDYDEWYQTMWVMMTIDDPIDTVDTDPSRGEPERADSTGMPRPAWNSSGQQDT
jgi:hypothetical protein